MNRTACTNTVAAASAALITVATGAATLTVDQNAPGCSDIDGTPFCTIGAALASAAPGDVIKVMPGTYAESLLAIVTPDIKLRGIGGPVIDGGCIPAEVILIATDGVTVKGLEIRNAGVGISSTTGATNLTIRDNHIENVDLGIEFELATESLSEGNTIIGGTV
jgi:nitrous oxidase accessory protein NosD